MAENGVRIGVLLRGTVLPVGGGVFCGDTSGGRPGGGTIAGRDEF